MTESRETAQLGFGHSVLCGFDTREDTHDFIANVIDSSRTSREVQEILGQSLVAGAEDWHYLIDCARSIQRQCGTHPTSLDGQDVLSYVWDIFDGAGSSSASQPWEHTDRLIARAKDLERDAESRSPSTGPIATKLSGSLKAAKTKSYSSTSHYWSEQPQQTRPGESRKWTDRRMLREPTLTATPQCTNQASDISGCPVLAGDSEVIRCLDNPVSVGEVTFPHHEIPSFEQGNIRGAVVTRRSTVSPYFTLSSSAKEASPKKQRPPPGTVSTVPFAPLTSPTFGVIQEEFGHDPFWLLVAVTFLIRTNGNVAIPVFYKVKERFPTPRHIVDPANAEELIDMIRHLGLSVVRVAFMQKYAKGFLEDPPKAGVRYKVKNYDRRDFDPYLRSQRDDSEVAGPETSGPDKYAADTWEDLDAWEIGHLTKGKYAIDSWRIFCRDELLGRAEDWNGKGREPEFQPEWMRVMPEDKELRAYLRWMWMREGWEWDPVTGKRTVLRDELQRAVNEGRVEYDDTGGLRILDEPAA